MTTPTKFRVGICGGGIGGLCLAVALSRYRDIHVDVYEAAERFKEIGAGVMIWAKTWRTLELLGLDIDASKVAHAPADPGIGFDFRRSDQPREGFRFYLSQMQSLNGHDLAKDALRFHRADFLDVFVNNLPSGVAHFQKRVVSYTQDVADGQIHLRFSDDSMATCDVLVGCDGIKSLVRAQMLQQMAENGHPELLDLVQPTFSGIIAYRGLIPAEKMPKDEQGHLHRVVEFPTMYCGKSKHLVGYSISRGSIVNVAAFASQPEKEGTAFDGEWVTEVPKEELLDCYADWEPEVTSLLECIDHPTRWAIHQLKELPNYVNGRVALLGDAAHAMTPFQGAGAGQAIDDAFILAELLGHSRTTKETLASALKAYEHIRLPMATHVLQGSRNSGRMYEFNGPHGEEYDVLGPAIQKQWDWIHASTPEEDAERAIAWMESNLDLENVVQ
ncbi:FAD/NAD-P-binding domain-containing protein [Gautieria morchelliformis]|nr:FAD/NAD-P-binding domain-containing protein [Gautieria morchelliformis]